MGCLGNILWFFCGGVIFRFELVSGRMPVVHNDYRYTGWDAVF